VPRPKLWTWKAAAVVGAGPAAATAAPASRKEMRVKRSERTIAFRCRVEDHGVIAEPQPARTVLPAWLRRLPGVDTERVSPTSRWPPRCGWRSPTGAER
jgi:hypothetical protein